MIFHAHSSIHSSKLCPFYVTLQLKMLLQSRMARSKDIMKVLYDFGQNTSILGVSNAAKAKSRTRSVIWLIIFTVCAALTIQSIVGQVLDYFDYPVITTTEITYESEV